MFPLNCQQYKITDEKTGQTLKNFEIKKNDLITADRVYTTITGMGYCLENGGDFISRIRNKAFNLYNAQGEQVLLTDWLETLDGSACGKLFYYKDNSRNYKPVRICALLETFTAEDILVITVCAGRWKWFLRGINPYLVQEVCQ